MSYFGFLLQFLGLPILLLCILAIIDFRRKKWMPNTLAAFQPWKVLLALCFVAFIYTSPWDNYLVATGVWYYDPNLVTGIILGYVPIEEYTFFLVQPVLTGLFFLLLARYLPSPEGRAKQPRFCRLATFLSVFVWLISTSILILSFFNVRFASYSYITLTLSWALIPLVIQLAFGVDILARHWLKVLLAIVIPTLYLSWADSLAINSGTWTINPEKSLNIFLGTLPLEEALFFLITNTLVVVGMTLLLAEESQSRAFALERFALLRPVLQGLKAENKAV